MAEGDTRLIVFWGSEAERRYWVRQKRLDDKRVLLALHAEQALMGRMEPVETWYCSGRHGLTPEGARRLHERMSVLNTLHGDGRTHRRNNAA